MQKIPETENALIIRTDYSDPDGWESLASEVAEPADPFVFTMELLDEQIYEGASIKQLMASLPEDYPHSFMMIADQTAISEPGHPLLVVDLLDQPGRHFRTLAAEAAAIDNNLSLSNMEFGEFAGAVDEHGVFRGFSGSQ